MLLKYYYVSPTQKPQKKFKIFPTNRSVARPAIDIIHPRRQDGKNMFIYGIFLLFTAPAKISHSGGLIYYREKYLWKVSET